jgi:hypothetical protein
VTARARARCTCTRTHVVVSILVITVQAQAHAQGAPRYSTTQPHCTQAPAMPVRDLMAQLVPSGGRAPLSALQRTRGASREPLHKLRNSGNFLGKFAWKPRKTVNRSVIGQGGGACRNWSKPSFSRCVCSFRSSIAKSCLRVQQHAVWLTKWALQHAACTMKQCSA